MYLLDTNTISELRKVAIGKGHSSVAAWAAMQDFRDCYTSAVVMMELEHGVLAMARKDVRQGQVLRTWLDHKIKQDFKERILTIDAYTAEICAKLHIPDRSPENDAWIAAQAIQHGLIVATRNEKDFAALGVRVFNPFADI